MEERLIASIYAETEVVCEIENLVTLQNEVCVYVVLRFSDNDCILSRGLVIVTERVTEDPDA